VQFIRYPTFGFTTKANGIVRELVNQVHVSEIYDPNSGLPEPVKRPYNAIWDTGATNTVISPKVVQDLLVQPSGRVTVQAVGAGGQVHEFDTYTYLVNIYLPNHVVIVDVRASEGSVAGGDLLLGMDIISSGDFAITNHNGQTWWSFRVPSNEGIDFVKEIEDYKKRYGPQTPSLTPEELRKRRNQQKAERRKRRK
jgi:hypothetical protein